MKTIKTTLVIAFSLFLSKNLSAQINYTGGKIFVNNASVSNYGLNIKDWAGSYWSCHSDSRFFQLDASPANPRLAGTGDKIYFINTQTGVYNSIAVANVFNYSDGKAKENIKTVTSGLKSILNLRPVTYQWKDNTELRLKAKSTLEVAAGDSISTLPSGPADSGTQYGFIAQEVEQILPDAVKTNSDGHKMINYTAIIPVLVQAIQEMQATIEMQAVQIENLSTALSKTSEQKALNISTNKIISCTPNPTNGEVTISTQLDNNVNNAIIVISSITGNREKTLTIPQGTNIITENIADLNAGIHIVSLIANGVLTDSQRIIKD